MGKMLVVPIHFLNCNASNGQIGEISTADIASAVSSSDNTSMIYSLIQFHKRFFFRFCTSTTKLDIHTSTKELRLVKQTRRRLIKTSWLDCTLTCDEYLANVTCEHTG